MSDEKTYSITVYGASDDLIEFEGYFSEEFYLPAGDKAQFRFGDGSEIEVIYDEHGIWRIRSARLEHITMSVIPAYDDDDDNYSDVATIQSNNPLHLTTVKLLNGDEV